MPDLTATVSRLFTPDASGLFRRRLNRFVVEVEVDGQPVTAHLANSGRLADLLLPGAPVILERAAPEASHPWALAAVRDGDAAVPLIAARLNRAARELALPWRFPGANRIASEVRHGGSRFDLAFHDAAGLRHLVEVKGCTDLAGDTAWFPDAPSLRASRHLEELAALAASGIPTHVLFVVCRGRPRRLLPNLHVDPAFAIALERAARLVDLRALSLRVSCDGLARLDDLAIPVDASPGRLAAANRGSYLILLELSTPWRGDIGALGQRDFPAGWYLYCGSAQRNLSQRTARHLRLRKKRHWHLDYLVPHSATRQAFTIAGEDNRECLLAGDLARLGGQEVAGFGCSDCRCPSHLYRFARDPRQDQTFWTLLQSHRLTALAPPSPRQYL